MKNSCIKLNSNPKHHLQYAPVFLMIFYAMSIGNIHAQALTITGEVTTDCTCPVGEDNLIDITVTGGTPPYSFDWTQNGLPLGCDAAVDFSAVDGITCPVENGAGCPILPPCSTTTDAINAQGYTIQGATLTVSAPDPQGGACVDENVINDSHLPGTVALRTGVEMNGNAGPLANVSRTWNFSQPVCNLEIFINDLDDNDEIIINASLMGVPITLTAADFIQTNTTPDPACPTFIGGNTWQSQNCPAISTGDRGGFIVIFPSCLDEIEFVYYADASEGGSYSVGFAAICAQDLDCVPDGVYQLTVTDATGTTATETFTVPEPGVNENPSITCPADITVNVDPTTCEAVVTLPDPVVGDECPDELTISCTQMSGDVFPVGTTTVICTVTDRDGNTATCDYGVTVVDNEVPTIVNCPADITTGNDAGICAATVTWTPPTLDDNCPNAIVSSTFNPGDVFPKGTTAVTYAVTDAAGNSTTCGFNVTVNDTELPTIICPADITVFTDPGTCDAVVTWTPPTPVDNCPDEVVTSTNTPGETFSVGTTTVTYTVTDCGGNIATCSFDITVEDNQDPTITNCPADITVTNDAGACEALVNWAAPTTSDNCPSETATSTAASGDTFPIGTTTVVYTVTDAAGNTATCSFDVTVNDTEDPTITCPADITVSANVGVCEAVVNWAAPTTSDNCTGETATSTAASGDTFLVGTTTVVYTVTDAAGNTATCSFDVTVNDTEDPTILCPPNVTVSTDAGACEAIVSWAAPTTSDNCPGETATGTASSGDAFPLGTTTVTYTVTDAAGNTATCNFDVTVEDNETPIITCPTDITVNTDCNEATVNWTATSNDNCPGEMVVCTSNPGDTYPLGTTTVMCTVTDAAGNVATCDFNITVIDNVPEPLDCTGIDSVRPADMGVCTYTAQGGEFDPTSNANCSGTTITNDINNTATLANEVFPKGTTPVIWTVTDAGGNMTTCEIQITVNDEELPSITCPADITVENDAGVCEAAVTWATPTVVDNCPDEAVTSTHNPGDIFPKGTTTVTYTVTDCGGNVATCSFDVTVNDTEAPVITCPTDVTVSTTAGTCEATATWIAPTLGATASDNCPDAVITSTANPGDTFPIGTTAVTYTITDSGGNVVMCSFDIFVEDSEVPTITCPTDVTVSTTPGTCEATANWTIPAGSDNCSGVTVVGTNNPGDTFPKGTTTVTYTVTDAAGNTATCGFDVIVEDTELPAITCPADITIPTDAGVCTAAVTWTPPIPTDNCPDEILTSTHNPGDTFPKGTTTVTYTVTDCGGNIATCSFDVTVEDRELPVIICPTDVTVSTDAGICTATATWTPPAPTDNCPDEVVTSTHNPGDTFPTGTTTVTYTVTDCGANVVTCSFDVIVEDNNLPTITCPDDVFAVTDAGACTGIVNWTVPAANDDCSAVTLTTTNEPGSEFSKGTTTVVYTATDASGNIATCSFDVTVFDTELPVLNCPGNVTVGTDDSICEAIVTWTEPVPIDNCPDYTLTSNFNPGDTFPLGTTTVEYFVTDCGGNVTSCSFEVTVEDDEAPEIICPADVMVSTTPGICTGVATWAIPPPTDDNCDIIIITSTHESGDVFAIGTTTVVYTVTDAGGDASTCSFDVTVVDNEPPTITCPPDITATTDCNEAVVNWVTPSTDACTPTTIMCTSSPGDTFPLGDTQVTCTATDAAGNITTCDFTITVTDTNAPELDCSGIDAMRPTDAGTCTYTVQGGELDPTSAGNCPGNTLANNVNNSATLAGEIFAKGITSIIWTVTDAGGNTTTCEVAVEVNDEEFPTITCPANVTTNADPSNCMATVTWAIPIPMDNCPDVVLTSTHSPGDSFPVGTTMVTYTATDCNENVSTCSFDINVQDPGGNVTLDCPDDIIVPSTPGSCAAEVPWDIPLAMGGCTTGTVVCTNSPLAIYPVGTTPVTCSVMDAAGNTVSCTFNVIVEDNEPPIINCPEDITVSTDFGRCGATVGWTVPIVIDSCGVAFITYASFTPGSTFPVGTTTVEYIAADNSGNTSGCSFDITVTDMEPPTLQCPGDITVTAIPGQCSGVASWIIFPPTDNCTGATVICSDQPGSTFPIGTTTVSCVAADAFGNETTCEFDVIVNECIDGNSVTTTENVTLVADSDLNIGAADAMSFGTNPVYVFTDPATPANAVLSNITLQLFFRVENASCESDIEVRLTDPTGAVVYTGASFTTCNGSGANPIPGQLYNTTITIPSGATTGSVANWVAEFRDTNDQNTGAVEYTVRFGRLIYDATITTGGGNNGACGNPIVVNCPAPISQTASAGCGATITIPEPMLGTDFTDCSGATATNNVTGTSDASGFYEVGITVITWTFTDEQGNESTCQQIITITDGVNATLECPDDVMTTTTPGNCTAVATWDVPTFGDNCPGGGVTGSTHNPGDEFPIGITTVTYTAVDAQGNTVTCSFDVIVDECSGESGTQTIVLIEDNDFNVGTNDTEGFVANPQYTFADPATPANAILSNIKLDLFFRVRPNSCESEIRVRLTDPVGNVNVFAPFATCNGPGQLYFISIPVPSGSTIGSVADWVAEFRDTNDQNVGLSEYSVRYGRLTYDATVGQCGLPVIVNCPTDIAVVADAGQCGASVTVPMPVFGVDYIDCTETTVTNSFTGTSNASGSYPVGTTTVTWTFTDASGNSVSCTQDIVVIDNQNATLVCPADVTVQTSPGMCDAVATWDLPVFTDNCPGGGITSSTANPGDSFPIGTTTVNYTAMDAQGNTVMCSFEVTVEECSGGSGSSTETVTLIYDSDLFVGASDTESFAGNGTYLFTDPATPAAAVLSNITLQLFFRVNGNSCESDIEVRLTDPTGNANVFTPFTTCMGTGTLYNVTLNVPSGATTGSIANWTAEFRDTNDQNTAAAEYSVRFGRLIYDATITDNTACGIPTIIACPAPISATTQPGQCGANITVPVPMLDVDFTDCTGATITNSTTGTNDASGFYPVGTTTVIWTVTDLDGNTVTCTQAITVEDVEAPAVTCPADVMVETTPGNCDAVATWSLPTITDNCGASVSSSSHSSGDTFPLGTTTVSYTIIDDAGNTVTCEFDVIVEECGAGTSVTTPVVLISDSDFVVGVNDTENFADNSTYTFTDPATPAAAVLTNITLELYFRIQGASCESDIEVRLTDPAGNVNIFTPFASCAGAGPLYYIALNVPSGATTGNLADWTVEFRDTNDQNANTAEYSVRFGRLSYDATTGGGGCGDPIILNCPADISVSSDAGDCVAFVTIPAPVFGVDFTDCVGATISNSYNGTSNATDIYPVGTTTVTWTVIDDNGNITTCTQTVVVGDGQQLGLTCPDDITIFTDNGVCEAEVFWDEPVLSDNCGASITSTAEPGDTFPIGMTTVTYTAVDAAGNTVTCSFTITVEDNEAPVIACPAGVMVNTAPGACGAVATWSAPTVTDNCDTNLTATSNIASGSIFLPGTTVVTYTVTDAAGNTTTCSFDVTIVDNEPPVGVCPPDITVMARPGECTASATWDIPIPTDNCGAVVKDASDNPGDTFIVGTTTVTYTFIDEAGNTSTCDFTITVVDEEDPTITCPLDMTVGTDSGTCEAVVNWAVPTGADNCPGVSVSGTSNPGDTFPLGTTTVTYTVTDAAGNTTMCSFDITVEDTEAPMVTCPNDVTVAANATTCTATATWNIPNATDNCGNTTIASNTHAPGDVFELGTTTVTYIITDDAGNETECSFDVTVEDNTPPVILNCPSNELNFLAPPGECEGSFTIPVPMFGTDYTDCQQGTSITNSENGTANASGTYPVGTTVITWTATDPSGNSVTCEQTIIVGEQDLVYDEILVTDKDVFVGAGTDNAGFNESDSILITAPGIPPNATVNSVLLDFFFRPEGNSCEGEVEVEVTDPSGMVTIFPPQVTTCNGNDAIFQFLLPVASVPSAGGVWKLRFRDLADQNPVSAGSPGAFAPAGTEFSVRFGRITYNITVDPDCLGGGIEEVNDGSDDDVNDATQITENQAIILAEIVAPEEKPDFKLYPVPTTGRLNMDYEATQDDNIYIEVMDANGRIMHTERTTVLKGTNTVNMELFDLPGGLYYIKVMDSSGHIQAKPFTKLSP